MRPELINKIYVEGLSRGIVDKNLPANADDMGSTPGPGRFQMQH